MTTPESYRQEQARKERLDKLAKYNVHARAALTGAGQAPCGGNLSVAWGGYYGRQEYVLRCAKCGILDDDAPLVKIETPYDVWEKGGTVDPFHQAVYERLKRRKHGN